MAPQNPGPRYRCESLDVPARLSIPCLVDRDIERLVGAGLELLLTQPLADFTGTLRTRNLRPVTIWMI